ncbi:MAG: 2-C-methyl-D-erythritol 4-phosphate cytidylyltransferase [Phycisphaerales bacterium]|nr:2-C-methyl-D-erythritol 4-phosphate cytidylyltransferase [Phycisphaerales bacterium]
MSAFKIGVIIPAAGQGTRFGGDKLGQDLGGRPLLLRTVELFTKRDEVGAIVVAAPPDSIEEFRSRYAAQFGFHGVAIVAGGRTERWESVRNALAAVPDDCTHIAVHDAARPGATDALLTRVFDAARIAAAVVPGDPVSSTIKRVSVETFAAAPDDAVADAILGEAGRDAVRGRRVECTVDRTRLMAIQTPQVFEAALLRRAYAQGDLASATDDAMLVEQLGEPVLVVEGDPRNLKVTTTADLAIIRAILGHRAPEERPVHKRF